MQCVSVYVVLPFVQFSQFRVYFPKKTVSQDAVS